MKAGTTNEVERVIEKPKPEEAPSLLMSYGRFIMTPKIFDYLVPDATGKDNELWLQDANDKVAINGKVLCHKVQGEWMTTGDPLRYMKAHIRYALNDPEIGEEIRKFITELVA
jgi:UTP--glucose-1-phosphate uridylyltransferase